MPNENPTTKPDIVAKVACLGAGVLGRAILQEYMAKMARSDFFVSGTIGQIVKDLETIRSLARNSGACMPMSALLSEFYYKLMAQHSGEVDTAEVIRLYR